MEFRDNMEDLKTQLEKLEEEIKKFRDQIKFTQTLRDAEIKALEESLDPLQYIRIDLICRIDRLERLKNSDG